MTEVDIVIPVYNEEQALIPGIQRLHHFLSTQLPWSWRVLIVDNASTDATSVVASDLAARLDGVEFMHLDRKGRGLALRSAWESSHAEAVAYMDVDLSTDLTGLAPLLGSVLSGHSEVAIGTRLRRDSHVRRGFKREFISRTYNRILRLTLHARFSDAQCGFKAARTDVVQRLLPYIEDEKWFFDTELLVMCERQGLRIHEVPVDWVEDPQSSVNVMRTAIDDLRGVRRLMFHRRPRPQLMELPRMSGLRA